MTQLILVFSWFLNYSSEESVSQEILGYIDMYLTISKGVKQAILSPFQNLIDSRFTKLFFFAFRSEMGISLVNLSV